MPVRIRVMNCQSIRDATIVVDGFTAITGANNSGKTALMRAIQAPFINAPVSTLVRHGTDDLVVAMDFGEGHTLGFKKGKSKPTYKINGVGPIHPGNSTPDELEALGVVPIIASNGRDKLWPQIATQFASNQFSGPVFLLDQSGSLLAEVVADVERVGKLSRALKLCEKDIRTNKGVLKTRKKDRATTQTELDSFLGLDGVVASVTDLESQFEESQQLQSEIDEMAQLEDRYATCVSEMQALSGIIEVALPPVSDVEEAEGLATEAAALGVLHGRWTATKATVDATMGITEVEVPTESLCEEAEEAESELGALVALEGQYKSASHAVKALQPVSDITLPDTDLIKEAEEVAKSLEELVTLSSQWEEATEAFTHWKQAVEAANTIDLEDTLLEQVDRVAKGRVVLSDLEAKHAKANDAIADAQDDLTDIEGQLESANYELTELLSQLDTCPTCDTPMAQTHLHKEIA